MNLHASRSVWRVSVVDLVQSEYFTRGRVELVMVDLERCQGRVEGELDVGGPRRILDGLQHGGGYVVSEG